MAELAERAFRSLTIPIGYGRRVRDASERELIGAIQKGSPDAAEALVRRWWREAHAVALGIVGDRAAAEDIAQEAMLAALRGLDSFDRRRPFGPWFQRIVTNRALDWLRARERRSEAELTEDELPGSAGLASGAERRIDSELVAAMSRLTPHERAVIVLRHIAGFGSKQIAAILDTNEGTVRSTLHRALARVRAELEAGSKTGSGRSEEGT